MQVKKLLFIGIIGIVLLGCIFAAGCTTTTTTNTPSSNVPSTPTVPTVVPSDTSITGTWYTTEWDDGVIETKTLTVNSDGTGTKQTDNGKGKITTETFTWSGTEPTFEFVFKNGLDWDTYHHVNGALIHDHSIYTRNLPTSSDTGSTTQGTSSVSIVGTWTASELDHGVLETKTLTINSDGTGTYLKDEGYGETKQKSFAWHDLGYGSYRFIFGDGDTDTYYYTNGFLYHDGTVYTKQ